MPKPTKAELKKYKTVLQQQLATLRGDVGSMRDEALRASDQDASVDHLADQGTDNYDQGFMLGLIENEEETIKLHARLSWLSLIAGGALGNILDRWRQGAVTDFLDFHWRGWHWPAFNGADVFISLGVLMLLVAGFKPVPKPETEEQE